MIGFFDCFSGVSGDMILGALLDCGWPESELLSLPERLGLQGVALRCGKALRRGISAHEVSVQAGPGQPLRTLPAIQRVIDDARLPEDVRQRSISVFQLLAEAEADVHGCPVDEVHFHEVGAVDTVIDVTGAILGLHQLGVERCHASPLPVSQGFIRCSHGTLPVPAPAVARLMEGIPVRHLEVEKELVTPTGLAILRVVCSSFGSMPAMTVIRAGYGAGSNDLDEIPNLLRLWLGRAMPSSENHSPVTVLTTSVDDMNPEFYPYVTERLLKEGALDVYVRQVLMKKGRPGCELVVLSPPDLVSRLSDIIFCHTSTSGIRMRDESRLLLKRRKVSLETRWGKVNAKVIQRPEGRDELVPEFEECRRISEEYGLPISLVYQEIKGLAHATHEDDRV